MKLTGAKIFVESLKQENVEVLFNYPGGQVIPIFDALHDDTTLHRILPRHEQAAVHAADAYARVTGKVGVVLVTSGPGATNAVTGIANAYMDSVPIVVFTGQVGTHLIGNDAFQEADITGITRPITKHNFLVKDVKELTRTIKEAFHIASTGRPGPVLVDIPIDIQRAETEFVYPETVDIRSYKPNYEGHIGQIKKAAEFINASKKPVLYVGGGVIISGASHEVQQLAEKAEIPITVTLMAIGSIPFSHRLSLGMLGMHGTFYANHSVQNADLIISVGSRFDDRVTGRVADFAPHAKIIHIDIDPTSISKTVRVDVPVVGDARLILHELLPMVESCKRQEWLATIDAWKKEEPLTYKHDHALRPQYVIEEIAAITKGNAIICTDVGQHQMWSAQYCRCNEPRTFVSSGGLGTMGFGLPAGIGAKLGRPDKDVIVITGDGGIQMNIQELATAVHNKLPIKIVILNNGYLGMVRQWQELLYNKRYSSTPLEGNPDFVKVAEAYGAVGMRITKKDEVRSALEKAMKLDTVVVMDFIIEPEENVFPFVPAGKALHEIIRGMA